MKKNHTLIITSLFLFYAINNYIWLSMNKLPVSYDEGIHLWTNLRFVRAFVHPTHNILYGLSQADTTHWPPLFYFIASLFNLIFGTSYIVSVMTNMLFFLLLIVALYLIGKEAYSPSVGILSAIIVSFYPIIYGHSRLFQLDFALTAIVTFSIYCLISTDRFRNLKWSIIFGIAAGMGMLIKWSYPLFILPLLGYIIIACLRNIKEKDFFLYRLRNLLIAIAIGFLISSTWYSVNINKAMHVYMGMYRYITIVLNRYTPDALWLLLTFNNNMLSFPFLLLFIFCLILFYARTDSGFKLFVTIWYLVPMVVLSWISWKLPRFFLPLMPCFALISAIGLDSIKNWKLKNTILLLILALGLVQYFSISFNTGSGVKLNKSQRFVKDLDIIYKPYLEGTYSIMGAGPPHTTDWRQADIARSFADHIQELKGYPFILGIIYDKNDIGLNSLFANRVMNYYVIKKLMNSDAALSEEITLTLNQIGDIGRFIDFIPNMQGIIYISKDKTWPRLADIEDFFKSHPWSNYIRWHSKVYDRRLLKLIDSRENFNLIDRIKLPSDYYANLYLYKMPEIKQSDLVVKMFNGRIKIFYRQKEVTKDIGVVSEFLYNNKANKYNEAIWGYNIILPREVIMISEWPAVGIIQSTLIGMDPNRKNTLNIKVKLESRENITLDGWYVNSLLSNEYKEWTRPFSKGVFKKIYMFLDPDRFEPLDLEYSGPNIIGIKENVKESLPAILFRCSDTEIPMRAGISNTNYYHNARCVYITADSKIFLEAGRSKDILNVDISLLDNSELENIISGIEKESF